MGCNTTENTIDLYCFILKLKLIYLKKKKLTSKTFFTNTVTPHCIAYVRRQEKSRICPQPWYNPKKYINKIYVKEFYLL